MANSRHFNIHAYVNGDFVCIQEVTHDVIVRKTVESVLNMKTMLRNMFDRVRVDVRAQKYVGDELFDIPIERIWGEVVPAMLQNCHPSVLEPQCNIVLMIYTTKFHTEYSNIKECLRRQNKHPLQSYSVFSLLFAIFSRLCLSTYEVLLSTIAICIRIILSMPFIAIVSFFLGCCYCEYYSHNACAFVPISTIRNAEGWIRILAWEFKRVFKELSMTLIPMHDLTALERA